jgi:hypothetical protein
MDLDRDDEWIEMMSFTVVPSFMCIACVLKFSVSTL